MVVRVSAIEEDVISALTNLGYQRALAEKAVERAVQSAGRENFDAIFRAALGGLVEVKGGLTGIIARPDESRTDPATYHH